MRPLPHGQNRFALSAVPNFCDDLSAVAKRSEATAFGQFNFASAAPMFWWPFIVICHTHVAHMIKGAASLTFRFVVVCVSILLLCPPTVANPPARPVNDDYTNAISLPGLMMGQPITYSSVGATREPSEPDGGDRVPNLPAVWWKWKPFHRQSIRHLPRWPRPHGHLSRVVFLACSATLGLC